MLLEEPVFGDRPTIGVMEALSIRAAVPADIPLLAPIEAAADLLFVEAGHPEVSGVISDNDAATGVAEGRIMVAELGGTVLGWIHVGRLAGELFVEQISVHPDHHRRGIGSRLMRHVIGEARDANEDSILLDTRSDVPWNQPWYEQLGFVVVPQEEWTEAMTDFVALEAAGGTDWGTCVYMRWRN